MKQRHYVFGSYRLDPVARTLLRCDKPVPLTPKAVETLAVLLENGGNVVLKETLLRRIWAGSFVGDGSLMRNISDLRKMFAGDGEPDYIDTIPRRGYRFNGAVRIQSIDPSLRRSVAVLPFRRIGGGTVEAAMGLAVVELTITKLSTVRECSVHPAGDSAERAGNDPVAAGLDMCVDFVVEGTIRWHLDQGRVSVRVHATADRSVVWAETLEERSDGSFAFEDAVSDELAGALALIVTNAERKLLVRRYTDSGPAYQAYLDGRFHWALRSQAGLLRGIERFLHAASLDPSYAPAHSGLASSYSLMPMLAPVPAVDWMPRAKAAALHALEVDDRLLEARGVLAFVAWHYDWKWTSADREFRTMLKFEPGDALTHIWYALLLAERGDAGAAIAHAREAEALDPRSDGIRANVATVLLFCGRYAEAVQEARAVVASNPAAVRAYFVLALALEQQQRTAEAITALETAVTASRSANAAILGAWGHACARSGRHDGTQRALKALDALSPDVSSAARAVVRLGMNDSSGALQLLDRACDSREFGVVTMAVDPRLTPLRQSPEFHRLLERIGLT